MGLLEQEIYELRKLKRDYDDKKVDEKQVHTKIAIYSQVEKRAKLLLQAYISGTKIKKGLLADIFKTNLIGSAQAIDTCLSPEEEKVMCPDLGIITRQSCIERYGSPDTHEVCTGCEIGIACRKVVEIISPGEKFRQGIG